ncbi:peptidyl-prolyl cis-trans isomerase, partial [Coccomyxa subellipsoidea C-169]
QLAKLGQKVGVRYRGTLAKSGKVFDETKGNKTFSFRLGVGEVIKGWDRGVVGMRVGDKRRLTVPPQMAYGTSGVRGAIPPNATLNFDVELVDVKGR